MAKVSDDQQRKGNLGGPDLFLAPIGRIDADKISKYYCNTCEKEYEGGPKIEYENPNEEVAENLILLEKGQYICNTCNSTLAEYREFRKPDEHAEVGLAKPITKSNYSFEPSSKVSQPTSAVDTNVTSFANMTTQAETQPSGSGFSSIVGMDVYDENAKKVGTAKQIGVDSTHSLVLVITANDGNDRSIPWNQIKKVGQIILLGTPSVSSFQTTLQEGKCSSCGFVNKEGSKFCEECGTKL
jgi:sporulation protein YlmC with PRC-barrel domain